MDRSGIVLAGSQFKLPALLDPLSIELTPCFWLIDAQSGPFNPLWIDDSPENEALFEKCWVDVPARKDTSCTCWRPGTLPRLAEHVMIDEWTYFLAMRCAEEELDGRVERFIRRHASNRFFEDLADIVDLYLFHADGWWELYTPHKQWREKFSAAFPTSFERSSREAGSHPPIDAYPR